MCCAGSPVYVVMELANSGNLKDYLRQIATDLTSPEVSSRRRVTLKTLLHYAWQITRGMTHIARKRVCFVMPSSYLRCPLAKMFRHWM